MIVTVFRSRLRPEAQSEYMQWARRMSELAPTMPGYVAHKGFAAEDGERLTYVAFETEEALRGWAIHPEHAQAKLLGRQRFFAEYQVQICTVIRESKSSAARG